ncbi:MAG TPA: PAS domain-containing protein [Polyangiaceae bacterium]
MEDERSRLIDTLPGLIWIAAADARIEFLNQPWCEYTGLSIDEMTEGWHTVVHPQDLRMVQERWPLLVACEKVFEMEVRLRRSDGEYRWFLLRSCPLPDASGKIVKWCGISTDIEERKRGEQTLRTLHSNLRQMCDTIPGLVCTMSPTGEVELFNRELLEYFGKTAEEMKGWATNDAVHPDDSHLAIEAHTKAVVAGTPWGIEHRCRRFDGTYRWFQVRALPMKDADGAIAGWFVLLTDIENRKQAEEAIRANEHNLNLIINTIPALAWSAQRDGLAEFFNQHYLDYLGLTPEQAQGNGWVAAVHPDDLPGLLPTWRRILASEALGETEARLRRFDGEYRWFLFRVNPLREASGQIVKWYGTNTDIDDRKRAEEGLRRSEAFLAEGQRLSQTGSFSWFVDSDEWTLSDQAHRIFGFEPGADARVTLEQIAAHIHPEDLPLLSAKAGLAQRGVAVDHDYEFRLRMPDGTIKHLRTNAYQSSLRGRRELIGAIQDITAWRRSEETLGEVRSELAHMTRVASLGALTASIAHEVNQPLSGIITNANTCLRMLAADPPNVEGARETARRTIRDGNRASDVITRLRALFAKKDVFSEWVDLNEATREVLALSRSELHRGRVVLRSELADDLPAVVGDRVQLQQVILNLLLNASAAMSGIDDRPRTLLIKTEREQGDYVKLTVCDAGVGLDPQTTERLFGPFYSTKRDGMGLGLSVSRSIIENHNGRLWARPNDVGPGAVFCFVIPRVATSGKAARARGS